jgi:5'-phosphate synthase pdxT subunit
VRVGVFALQGDVVQHVRVLNALGCETVEVRNPGDLGQCEGLVVPGGESTTFGKLASRCGLDLEIIRRANAGMPIFGTCAGLIMMAKELVDYPEQPTWKLMDVTVRRNAYGRQLQSAVEDIEIEGVGKANVAFIRAPFVTRTGPNVKVLAKDAQGNIVFVEEGNKLGAAFHPEMTGNLAVHRMFIEKIRRM